LHGKANRFNLFELSCWIESEPDFKNKTIEKDKKKERIDDKFIVVFKELCLTGFVPRLLGWLELVEIAYISPSKEIIKYNPKHNSIKLLIKSICTSIELMMDYIDGEIDQNEMKIKAYELFKTVDMAYYWDDDYGEVFKFIKQELGDCNCDWKDVKTIDFT
jgi:hypothetical protein